LRETDCEIESEGIRRAEAHSAEAHLSIYMIDASEPLHEEDRIRLKKLNPAKSIVVLNKVDRGIQTKIFSSFSQVIVEASIKKGDGISSLKEAITALLGDGAGGETLPHAVISERHRHLLVEAREESKKAQRVLAENMEENAVFAVEHLRCALELIGEATGRIYHEELLENIFSRFCIGK
jgi:tRNA modification GTPase